MSTRGIVSQIRLIERYLRLPKVLAKPLLVSDLREDQRLLIDALEDRSGLLPEGSRGKLHKILPNATPEEVDAILNEILNGRAA